MDPVSGLRNVLSATFAMGAAFGVLYALAAVKPPLGVVVKSPKPRVIFGLVVLAISLAGAVLLCL